MLNGCTWLVNGRVQGEDPSGPEPLLEGGDGLQGIVEGDLRISRNDLKRVEYLVHDGLRFDDLANVNVFVQHTLGDSVRRVHAPLRRGKNSPHVELVVLEDGDVPFELVVEVLEDDDVPQASIMQTSTLTQR